MKLLGSTVVLLAAVAPIASAQQETVNPGVVEGLVARYEVSSVHLRMGEKSAVDVWRDSSGNGHELAFADRGIPGLFRKLRVNQQPTIEIRKGGYNVQNPFELHDHTIFIVASSASADRALFQGDEKTTHGIVLFEQGRNHVVRAGGVGTTPIPYTTLVTRTPAFDVTVLARDAGRMHAFTNGEMISSGKELATPLRVGRFFHLDFSQYVDKNGMGLEIAEMIFYDRYLPRVDREAVTRYLIERYGLQQRIARQDTLKNQLGYLRGQEDAPVALLGTEESIELNVFDDVAAVPWTLPDRTSPPFVHKPDDESATQIRCGSEGTLVRIYLSLRMWAGNPGSKIRVFLLRNGTDYLADHAESGEFGGADNGLTTVELETTAFLDSGDYLEVITEGVGAEGEVLLVPDESLFFAHAPSH